MRNDTSLTGEPTPESLTPNPQPLRDRAAISRANSLHSTGPRTAEGRRRSSMNAMRHGLTSQVVVMPGEDMQAYERKCHEFFDEYNPQGATENQLVQDLADTAWRLNRIPALESNLFSNAIAQNADDIPADHPQAQAALAMAQSFAGQTRAFLALSTIGQRLSRHFEKTLQQLRQLQSERHKKEEEQLESAADHMLLHQELTGTPYEPAQDGFVFSTEQVETFLKRRTRKHQVRHAAFVRPQKAAA